MLETRRDEMRERARIGRGGRVRLPRAPRVEFGAHVCFAEYVTRLKLILSVRLGVDGCLVLQI